MKTIIPANETSTANYLLARLGYAVIVLLGILGCSQADPNQDVLPQAKLEISIDVAQDGTGTVTIEASYPESEYYEFESGEENPSQVIRDQDGKLKYTYKSSGSYVIKVRAYLAKGTIIEKQEHIDVVVDEEQNGEIPGTGYSTPTSYDGYELKWSDEFIGDALNESHWTYETGTGTNGWGNNELQYYRKENTSVKDGCLLIEARQENFGGKNYTSSRLITKGKEEFKYGRVDIRAALPKGQGIWPALWMLGANFETVGWPACGEIDIMELIGGADKDNTVHGTIHWDHAGDYASYGNHHSLSEGIFYDEFHVFSIIWDAREIRWFVDDKQYNTADITPAALSEFHNKFFFIFNVAVGGNWPGDPDGTTSFPQQMIVDYIRVFQGV